jgi:hypothetical protein
MTDADGRREAQMATGEDVEVKFGASIDRVISRIN